MNALTDRIKERAHTLGFELVGIAPATDADGFTHLQEWLQKGCAGEMDYLSRHADAHRHPESILPDVKSVVMVGINYKPTTDTRNSELGTQYSELTGHVSCYAGGLDYHDVIRDKLKALLAWIQEEAPDSRGRAVIDTAPLLERDFARRAGLGWFGKNTMLIDKKLGSFFFLGALVLDLALKTDDPFETSHCGTCTRCLDACPTDAFVAAFQLDARRCISYLTIELRSSIPEDLRSKMENWIFGCDVCQDVCPWNRKSLAGSEPLLQATVTGTQVDLLEILRLSDEQFRARFRHTPIWRAKRVGLLRNAAIVLGNRGDARALPVLREAVTDAEPLIREAAQWAITRIEARDGSVIQTDADRCL